MIEHEGRGEGHKQVGRLMARAAGRGAAGSAAIALAVLVAAGCGQAPFPAGTGPVTTPPAALTTTTRVSQASPTTAGEATTTAPSTADTPSSSSSSTVTSAEAWPDGVDEVFAPLAASVEPMVVFAPATLPEGTAVAQHWLPVIASAAPQAYDGPEVSNPKVVGSGAETEIQAVFTSGRGWIVVIENFHGDLGDVEGMPVGAVDGDPAGLFEVNGGELVQWSRDGRWYGVFGRGLSRDAVVGIALGMKTVPARAR